VKPELEFHAGHLTASADPPADAGRPPLDYLELAHRYRWSLVGGFVGGLVLGALAYLKLGPEYEATAQVLVARRNTVPIREEQRTLTNWGERTEHIALILSPMIVGKAVELGHLAELPTFRGSEDPVDDVLGGLKVKRSAGQDRSLINVLSITYTSKHAADAHAVVEAVIAAYAQYLEETRHEQSTEVLKLAQKAHDEILQKLRAKEQEYLEFRQAAPLQWRTPSGATLDTQGNLTNVHQERVLAIEEQRRQKLLRQAELRSRLAAVEKSVAAGESREALEVLVRRFLAMDGPNGGDAQRQQEIATFENRMLPLLLEEKRLTRDFGKDHPEVQNVRKSIETTLEFYRQHGIRLPGEVDAEGNPVRRGEADFIALYAESLKQELAELELRDRELAELFERELAQARELARFQSQDQALNAEVNRIRDLWEQLVAQVNQVSIEKDSSGYSLKQLGPVKSVVSLKRLLKIFGAGGLFGAGIVACWALLREWRDTTLRFAKDVQLCLRRPILGGVREFRIPWPCDANGLHPALRYWHAPRSMEAENIRAIRAALSVAAEDRRAHVIQVASPEPGDGKTTLAANLAIAEAQAGKRVLLVDADLRRPCVHALFNVPQGRGLSEALTANIPLHDVLRESVVDGLTLLTAGLPPTNPAEVLSSTRWQRVVNELKLDFDLILVDSPPLLAVSDACDIGRQTDGLLLVVRLGKNRRPVVIRARDLIAAHNLPLLGVVANSLSDDDEAGFGCYEEYLPQRSASPRRETELAGV
jgi:succinoglycan biosynthesis transport protein ExoP